MPSLYEIHPQIGVARLGNSRTDFYLAPDEIGGLPLECDQFANPTGKKITHFKDSVGAVKRQAAKFTVYEIKDGEAAPVDLSTTGIEKIEWTVHIANKKPVWFTFSELQGDLNFGEYNSYEKQRIPVNNPDVTNPTDRQKLIIDPGPRTLMAGKGDPVSNRKIKISRFNIPDDYPHGSFPPVDAGGRQIDDLGEMIISDDGKLAVLGGFGNVTGDAEITSFRGAAGYWDDIADGYVYARIHLSNGDIVDTQPAWVIIGSPKFAPEIVNITTLADTMTDVAVRQMGAKPEMYGENYSGHTWSGFDFEAPEGYTAYCPLDGFNPEYRVHFERDIAPIIDRMRNYRWVANVPAMAEFASPNFDMKDATEANKQKRLAYFKQFRIPLLPKDYSKNYPIVNGPSELFPTGTRENESRIPLMPLNSGDNSVTNNGPIYKFETLSLTQYFCLYQWAQGVFDVADVSKEQVSSCGVDLEAIDAVDAANCVGAPFSPGIEVTWSVRSKHIYQAPLSFKVAHNDGFDVLTQYYQQNGLSISANETEPGSLGVEPGDLTKRMAIPWMADFQECTVQTPNISNPFVNQLQDGSGIQAPPAFYVYWWPPQSPFNVITGTSIPQDQILDAYVSDIDMQPIIPEGQDVLYQRGIYTPDDMINHWSDLGFIIDRGTDAVSYQVETERNFGNFAQAFINLRSDGQTTNIQAGLTK